MVGVSARSLKSKIRTVVTPAMRSWLRRMGLELGLCGRLVPRPFRKFSHLTQSDGVFMQFGSLIPYGPSPTSCPHFGWFSRSSNPSTQRCGMPSNKQLERTG